jgi:D-alanyl-D-alanine carboxypeptidase (penicillin-binding protein 5/6)
MTAYLVLRDHPLRVGQDGPTITLTDADVADTDRRRGQEESVVPVAAGERLTELQALQALLLPSANNVAAVLARWHSGSVERFVARMNAAARSLGMTHTRYTDPSGYDEATVSTAVDQLRLVDRAMRLPVFASVVATPSATLPVAGTVHNTNRLLGHGGFVGVKTGSTSAAGGCLAFRAVRWVKGKRTTITGVVLGQPGHDRIAAGLATAAAMVDRIAGASERPPRSAARRARTTGIERTSAFNRERSGADVESVIGVLRRERAGRSAARKHELLAKQWRRRTFGPRTGLLAYLVLSLVLVVLILDVHLPSGWALGAGVMWGMTATATRMIPDVLMPSHIHNWQFGAWGEENTASELRPLRRRGWTIRHDVGWGRGNHDHVVSNGAVFVLNSKNLCDSRVTIESGVVRVTRIDNHDDSYVADRWVAGATREAESLQWELRRELGWGVAVYPVIVVWGAFADEQTWVDSVCIVRGDRLVDFLESRPADLLQDVKRAQVAEAVRALPRAS